MPSKPQLLNIPIDLLHRGQYQPRREFDAQALQELADSIRSAGLIQPIVVRPRTATDYEIIAGERRWRAAQLIGLDTVPCLINSYSDEQAAAVSTIENINRVDLNPIEEAFAYQRLIDEFNYVHDEVAAIVGKSRAKITNSLRLLKLDQTIQQLLIEKRLTEGHGKVLAGLPTQLQREIAKKALSYEWSVRRIEQEIKKLNSKDESITEESANIFALERALGNHLGCPIQINFEDGKGKLTVDFHNLEIFEGILQKIGYVKED